MRTRLCIQPVVHNSRMPRIDDRIAGAPAPPGFENFVGIRPGKRVELRPEVALCKVAIMEQEAVGELAPTHFGEEFFCGRRRAAAGRRPARPAGG